MPGFKSTAKEDVISKRHFRCFLKNWMDRGASKRLVTVMYITINQEVGFAADITKTWRK